MGDGAAPGSGVPDYTYGGQLSDQYGNAELLKKQQQTAGGPPGSPEYWTQQSRTDWSDANTIRLNNLGNAGQGRQGLQNDQGLSEIAGLYSTGQKQAAYLKNAMLNGGPSVAALQQSSGLDASLHNAAGSMGRNAMGARGAMGANAGSSMQTVTNASEARNAEQQKTQQEYMAQLGQNAGLSESTLKNSQFNASQEATQRDLNDKYQLGMQGLALNTQQAQLNSDLQNAGYANQIGMQQNALAYALKQGQIGMGLNAAGGGLTAAAQGLGGPDPQDNAQYRQAWNDWDPSMGGTADSYAQSQMSDVRSKRRIRSLENELAKRDTYEMSDGVARRVTPDGYDPQSYQALPRSATYGADGFRFRSNNPTRAEMLTRLAENGYGRGIAETYADEGNSEMATGISKIQPSRGSAAGLEEIGLSVPWEHGGRALPSVPNAEAYDGREADIPPSPPPVDTRSHRQKILDAGILSTGALPRRVAPTSLDLATDRLSDAADRRAASLLALPSRSSLDLAADRLSATADRRAAELTDVTSDVHSKKEIARLTEDNEVLKELARPGLETLRAEAEQRDRLARPSSSSAPWDPRLEPPTPLPAPYVRNDPRVPALVARPTTPLPASYARNDPRVPALAGQPGRFMNGRDTSFDSDMDGGYIRSSGPLVALRGGVEPQMQTSQLTAPRNKRTHINSDVYNEALRRERENAFSDVGLAAASRVASPLFSSDEKKKTHIDRFLDNVQPVSYDYKNPEVDGRGRQYGIIAQDLQKSPMGRSMVVETPRGLMVDTRKAALGGLAALAEHQRRIEELEQERAHHGGT